MDRTTEEAPARGEARPGRGIKNNANVANIPGNVGTRNNFDDPATLRFWREKRRWLSLPYRRGRWKGPYGRRDYIVDRKYRVIAFAADGQWVRGWREPLAGCCMCSETAESFWIPETGTSPQINDKTLVDLLRRCAANPATVHVLEVEQ